METELTQHILWHGVETAPATPQWLTAGPLAANLEEGQLRGVFLGGREVVRRIYGAVRDRYWNTVPGVISELNVVQQGAAFDVSFVSTHVSAEVDFVWQARITGDGDGTLRYAFTGTARREMMKNRVGLCLLLPPSLSGQTAEVEYVSGDRAAVAFPGLVDPAQPVRGLHDFRGLTFPAGGGAAVTVSFEGDVFEIEDQRNWTDASFKAYSTPQRIPLPGKMAHGQQVAQVLTLRLNGVPGGAVPVIPEDPEAVELSFGGVTGRLPDIGTGVASHGEPLTSRELERLRALQLSHYRVEIDFSRDGWEALLERGLEEAAGMDALAEVVLMFSDDSEAESLAAEAVAARYPDRVGRWLALTRGAPASGDLTLVDAGDVLAASGTAVGGGTDADFFQLNNHRPAIGLMDFVSVPLRPCAHQFDRATLVENLAGQKAVLQSLAALYPGLPLVVSPVSFRTRAQKGPAAAPGELPAQADVRQMSLLGAAWTAGCIKALAESGVSSVTLFQTTGLRGLMEQEPGSAAPSAFHSVPGGVFPVYHVLAALAGWRGAEVLEAGSAAPEAVDALVLQKDGQGRMLLVNYSPVPRRVTWRSRALHGARAWVLDASNAVVAMTRPEIFAAGAAQSAAEGMDLPPFAVARVDWAQG